MPAKRLAAGIALPMLLLLVAACSNDADATTDMTWSADITSDEAVLHTVQSENETVYGWNRLVGETEIDGETVEIEMLGNVAYIEGSGPFFGFVTLTFPGGDLLALEMDGEAEASADTSRADFSAELTVLGGTGRYAGVSGDGEWSGGRDATLGGAVHMDVSLELDEDR